MTFLGNCQEERSGEFPLRGEVLSPIEIIRPATIIAAEVVRMQGKLSIIEPGAIAGLIVVDGDPLMDLNLLQNQGAHLSVIMKQGRLHKNNHA